MNATLRHAVRIHTTVGITFVLASLLALPASAATYLLLDRSNHDHGAVEYTGVVALTIVPGFDNAKVTVSVDGQKVATNLLPPHHLTVDFGPLPVQHRITITATGPKGRRARWTETINKGNLPLTVKVRQIEGRTFEAVTTSPKDDPVSLVQLWNEGEALATLSAPPWRFEVPETVLSTGFVQVTARTRSGEEAADFWSPAGKIVAEEMQVRTIPIFVSVVDRDGNTLANVDRSQFRIIDNEAEARIVEFGKAFDQPISIALLLDASASMTYSMTHAAKAAADFVDKALKEGDRCSVTAIHDVPRRRQALTSDRAQIAKAVRDIVPAGRTALFDAVISGLRDLHDEKNRRAVVVLTDGSDTTSNNGWDDVQKTARKAGIPLYFIVYEGTAEPRDLEQLRFVAEETGGFVATATQQNLLARYEAIEKDLRAQFAIKYQIADFGKSNQYRSVRVLLDSPKLTARTIKGYFTP